MDGYLDRAVDAELANLLSGLPAIAIQGPKAVGKTESASRVASTSLRLDRPGQLALLRADRDRVTHATPPVLIDEWQLDPPIWDVVRTSVDNDRTPGRFVLTGSADPQHARIHSGAGRIVNLRMRPLSFAERQVEHPTVSLSDLLHGTADRISGHTDIGLTDYTREILASGFPGIRRDSVALRRRELSSYLDHALSDEVDALGSMVRRPDSLRAWLTAYAAATSGTASYESIADAVSASVRPARSTIIDYREALTQLWLLDPVPAWTPRGRGIMRLGRSPKHQLADPALAANLMGVTERTLLGDTTLADREERYRHLHDGPLLGNLFESLVTLSIRVHAQALELDVAHLRTHRGEHEVDLILQAEDGTVLAVEVKLAESLDDLDVRHLNWLNVQMGADLIDRVVITTGKDAYRRPDGVAVVPLALLGP